MEAKIQCCDEALNTWLNAMPVYKQKKSAEDAALTGEGSSFRVDVATRRYEISMTKHVYDAARIACQTTSVAYTLPAAPDETSAREQAEADLATKTADSKAATEALKSASILADSTSQAYAALSGAGGAPIDGEAHMAQLAEATSKARGAHETELKALTTAKTARTTADDATASAKSNAANTKATLTQMKSALDDKSMEFHQSIKDMQGIRDAKKTVLADAEAALTEKQQALAGATDDKKPIIQEEVAQAQGTVDSTTIALSGAESALIGKNEEYKDYTDTATTQITSAAEQFSSADVVLRAAESAQEKAQKDEEEAGVRVETADTALKKVISVQEQTHSMLQEAAEATEAGELNTSTLEKKASLAKINQNKAKKTKAAAEQAKVHAASLFNHAVLEEETALAKQVRDLKPADVKAWEAKMATNKDMARGLDATYSRFMECVDENNWLC